MDFGHKRGWSLRVQYCYPVILSLFLFTFFTKRLLRQDNGRVFVASFQSC